MRTRTSIQTLLLALGVGLATSFTTQGPQPAVWRSQRAGIEQTAQSKLQPHAQLLSTRSQQQRSTTALSVLLDVPDGFFTVTFPMLGFLLALSKNFVRVRMEENAWEQRLDEGRLERLRTDPTLTELDLRRKEASMEWSAYGKPRMEEERVEKDRRQETSGATMKDAGRRSRVKVMDRDEEVQDNMDPREYRMTDDEIDTFESEYGIEYDPYYDDPYAADELPDDKYQIDKLYGDRIYENGEIFYKDKESGLYYRQGAKPRNLNFWG
jgi:hypothetical protein